MRTIWIAVSVLIMAGSLATYAEEAAQSPAATQTAVSDKAQTTCPVMGESIDKSHYVDHNGKRVYFCCGMCPATFKADPEKYMKKLADDGVKLEDAPAKK